MCSLVCGRAYAHPNVSATLPSKGKRVRYLGLARARITRQACSYAFAHEMHAHSQPPVTPSRLAKKCCISTCAKADGEHVAGSMSALELYLSRHTPLAYTQRIYGKSMQVRVRVCPCVRCVLARALRGGWLAPIAMFRDADRALPVWATVCMPRALILRLGRRGWPARN